MLVERLDRSDTTRRQKHKVGDCTTWYEWPQREPSILEVPDELGKRLTETLPIAKYYRVFTGEYRTELSHYTTDELRIELQARGEWPSFPQPEPEPVAPPVAPKVKRRSPRKAKSVNTATNPH